MRVSNKTRSRRSLEDDLDVVLPQSLRLVLGNTRLKIWK